MDYEVAKFDHLVGMGREGFHWLIKNGFLVQKDAIRRNFFQPIPAPFNITFEGIDKDIFGIVEITIAHEGKEIVIAGFTGSGAKKDPNTVECAEGRIPVEEIRIVSVKLKELPRFAERPQERTAKGSQKTAQ